MPNRFNRKIRSRYLRKLTYLSSVKDLFFISTGIILASIGLKAFLLPNHFLDGGATGVSLLIERITHIELSVLIVVINIPFLLFGAKQISKAFALKSVFAIFSLAILIHFIELPIITSDKLLIAVFGGFFLGAGIGMTIRGGAVIDGTEVLAITVSRTSSLSVGDFIAIFNVVLFLTASLLISIETAMYSMLTYLSASKTVDFIINGIEEYIGVHIISRKADAIKQSIINNLGRGVTVFKSEKGYGSSGEAESEGKVLFCVVTRLEVSKLIFEIEKIDPKAFVVQNSIKDTKGGMIKKRPLH